MTKSNQKKKKRTITKHRPPSYAQHAPFRVGSEYAYWGSEEEEQQQQKNVGTTAVDKKKKKKSKPHSSVRMIHRSEQIITKSKSSQQMD
jgi:hypothetical protein